MLHIRQIRESDASALRAVLDSVCRERRFLAMLEAPTIERFQAFVSENVRRGLPQVVAVEEERIIGWCDVLPGDSMVGTAHVGRLGMGVLKEYRGQGIGKRLVQATIEQAKALGLEKIELSVYASNEAAIALYRKLGFREEGRKLRGRLVDGKYDDVVLMGFDLIRTTQSPSSPPPTATPCARTGGKSPLNIRRKNV